MFQKILIAEDFDSYNLAVTEALKPFSDATTSHVAYCDEALLKIRRALQEEQPFDLLVSDLSFKPDGKKVTLESGLNLVAEVRKIQPDIRIVIFSIENRAHPIQQLFDEFGIDAFCIERTQQRSGTHKSHQGRVRRRALYFR